MKPAEWVLLVAILAAAWMFRYAPLESGIVGETLLWDRWLHKAVRVPITP